MAEELRTNNSGVTQTEYHKAKQIEATPGAPSRNGDVLVPGYDVDGKLWTVQHRLCSGCRCNPTLMKIADAFKVPVESLMEGGFHGSTFDAATPARTFILKRSQEVRAYRTP